MCRPITFSGVPRVTKPPLLGCGFRHYGHGCRVAHGAKPRTGAGSTCVVVLKEWSHDRRHRYRSRVLPWHGYFALARPAALIGALRHHPAGCRVSRRGARGVRRIRLGHRRHACVGCHWSPSQEGFSSRLRPHWEEWHSDGWSPVWWIGRGLFIRTGSIPLSRWWGRRPCYGQRLADEVVNATSLALVSAGLWVTW